LTGSAPQLDRSVSAARIFWASWLGWMLDGFDSGIYIYILTPAVTDLLARSNRAVSTAPVALYGGYFFSVFMLGWACSMAWGWLADRIGRVKVMCLTILVYSVFTALCGLAPGLLVFGIFRFLAGFGIGGEWAAGVSLLHESVPERVRVRYAGWLHTATPTGQILAAGASLLYPILNWRGLFLLGILPALLTIYLRRSIPEPEKWRNRRESGSDVEKPSMSDLFRSPLARSTWPAALMLSCAIFGLWSTSFWAPTFVVTKVVAEGGAREVAQRLASFAGLAGSLGTLAACLLAPWIVGRFGSRRATGVFFFSGALLVAFLTYGYAAKIPNGLLLFMMLLPVLGFFTNGVFALYSIWLPEMFPSIHRASGSGFAFSFGRILGAAGPTAVGALVGATGSYPTAIMLVSLIYVIGLPFSMLSPETAHQPLPQ
jgi:MFS family permease